MENENAAFWLPTHFLTDDDFLAGDMKKKEPKNFDLFANGFDPFASPYPLDSPVSSTETERDHNSNDNEDNELLAELTRQLAHSSLQETPHHTKPNPSEWMFSTSPQSTLTGFGPWSNRSGFTSNGSPNGPSQVPSPPMTPPGPGAKNDAAWELLYEAAGQVARLKMNAIAAQLKQQNRGLLGAPRNPSLPTKSHPLQSFYDFSHHHQFQQQVKRQQGTNNINMYCQHHHHHQRRSCGGNNGGALGLPQSAWPPLRAGHPQQQPPHHNPRQHTTGGPGMRAMFLNGSGPGSGPVKRQTTGTGVFLPRRIGTQSQPQPQPRKKPTGCSTVLLPARVVQALNLDLDEMNNGANFNFPHPQFGSGFASDHEILLARRNALLSQQRRSFRQEGGAAATMAGHDILLPSDWTY